MGIGELDVYLYREGTHTKAYDFMGSHPGERDGEAGWRFTVLAPSARQVSVVGDFNNWDKEAHGLVKDEKSGIWSGFIPGLAQGERYKYAILTPRWDWVMRADPYAYTAELRPNTASRLWDIAGYEWSDADFIARRRVDDKPMLIYELHMGSWKRHEDGSNLTYREMADELVPYLLEMGFTHLELMPISEYPLDDSWGYQVTGYYAATSRYGTPQDFMYFVDACHKAGIYVFLDWVGAHFTRDAHGLRRFDGTALYEHPDPRRGEQPDWGTMVFNFGRGEVSSFLISNVFFWLDKYHIDGIRVDAVSSMLYLDYGRENRWLPNRYGGRENLDAIDFFRRLNRLVGENYPGVAMMAEESTSWPMVTKPGYVGGLGFHYKWNMGWMNDMLSYIKMDSIYRKHYHDKLTFSLFYAFNENYILPFSHDEVIHGKKTLLDKMPGDYWQMFAGLRGLIAYMYAHPGPKLLFMGTELAPFMEWRYYEELEWKLLLYEPHRMFHDYMRALNEFYKATPALYTRDTGWDGFRWLNANDNEHSIVAFMRSDGEHFCVIVVNFTPVAWDEYAVALPHPGTLREVFNTDHPDCMGSGVLNEGELVAVERQWNEMNYAVSLRVPPLGAVFLNYEPVLPEAQETERRYRLKSGAGKLPEKVVNKDSYRIKG